MSRSFTKTFIAATSLLFLCAATGFAQGTNTNSGDTGAGGTGVSADFDTGATLERTERVGRDTGTFVGAAAPTTGDFSAVNDATNPLGGNGNRANQNPLNNFFNQLNRANQFNNQQNQQNQLRIPLKLGFAKPPRPATQPILARNITTSVQARFDRLERFGPGVTVALDGNTAVLSGQIADDDSRRLAARMVMLEPGVTAVRNELQVMAVDSDLP